MYVHVYNLENIEIYDIFSRRKMKDDFSKKKYMETRCFLYIR